MSVVCKGCKKTVMWKKPYNQGDKPVEIDGSIHNCTAVTAKFTSYKLPLEQVPEFFDKACNLLETFKEKTKVELTPSEKAIFVESMFKTMVGGFK